jgi:hypothetical protein
LFAGLQLTRSDYRKIRLTSDLIHGEDEMLTILAELQKLSRHNMNAAERTKRWQVMKGLNKVVCSSIEGAVMSFVDQGPVRAVTKILMLLRNDPGNASFEVSKAVIRQDVSVLNSEARYNENYLRFFRRHFSALINKWR